MLLTGVGAAVVEKVHEVQDPINYPDDRADMIRYQVMEIQRFLLSHGV